MGQGIRHFLTNYHYLLWIPSLVVYYAIYYWISKQNNERAGAWFWYVYIFGAACPIWAWVCCFSKNILFDGMLYDIVMFVTFFVTMALLGAGERFALHQWVGTYLVLVGFVMMRIPGK